MEKILLIIFALFVTYYLIRPTSKEELKDLRIKTIGQIWDFRKGKMKKIFLALVFSCHL